MIKATSLSKSYADRTVVDELTFSCLPGRVTGLIGPNGSGKSTTMKMLLGIVRPSSGSCTILGQPYEELGPTPMRKVGALLDNVAAVPSRRAIDHMKWIGKANGISNDRIEHVLRMVGLEESRRRRVGTFSLGMKQRLGIGVALLGDPEVLILDEPMNGLDPAGIRWMRSVILEAASEAKTVLISSHFMNELEEVVDDVVIINSGTLLKAGSLDDVRGDHERLESAYFSLLEKENE